MIVAESVSRRELANSTGMKIGRNKLARQTGGRGFYADVTVGVVQVANGARVEVNPMAFAWLKDVYGPDASEWTVCDELRAGAVRGVRYALDHANSLADSSTLLVTIDEIRAVVTDTCPDSVALAACHATWNALDVSGRTMPRFVGRQIVFDE